MKKNSNASHDVRSLPKFVSIHNSKIVILNNSITVSMGLAFWITYHTFIVWAIVYSGTINWSQNIPWATILKQEIGNSPRLYTVLLLTALTNIMALRTLYKTLKSPKTVSLGNDLIESQGNFSDLQKLSISEISEIKKGVFPLIMTADVKEGSSKFFGMIIMGLYVILGAIIALVFRLFIWIYNCLLSKEISHIIFFGYITIFSKTSNKVVNIHIVSEEEYKLLKDYFIEKLEIDLAHIKTNWKISNFKKLE